MTNLLAAATLDGLAARWLPMMLDATIKGTAVLAVAGVALLAMRRTSAAARQLVLLVALVGVLIVPIVSLALPGWQVLPSWAKFDSPVEPPTQVTQAAPVPAKADATLAKPTSRPAMLQSNQVTPDPWPPDYTPIEAAAPPVAAPIEPAAEPAAPPPTPVQSAAVKPAPSPVQKWIGWGMVAWAMGVAVCLLPLVLGRISIWRLKRQAVPVTDGPLWDLANKAKAQLGLKGRVTLLVSHRRPMPMMWGIFQPVLLLPAEAVDWSADRLWVVMLHELGHVKRWDMLTKVLAHLAAAFYWFNPLVWLAYRQFQSEAERACDDLVLAAGSNPGDYAEHILDIASGLQTQMFATHGSIAMARPNRLEGRLLAILDPRRSRRRLSLMLILLAVLVGSAIMIPLSILRARDAAADKPANTETAEPKDAAATHPEKDAASLAPPASQPDVGEADIPKILKLFAQGLPDGAKVLRSAAGERPRDWSSTDRPGVLVEGVRRDKPFRIYFLPRDWIGLRTAEPKKGKIVYWEGVLLGNAYKTVTESDDPDVHEFVSKMNMWTPSLVNGGWPWAEELFAGRFDQADQAARAMLAKFCATDAERNAAIRSLIVMGIPAKGLIAEYAVKGTGGAREFCILTLRDIGGPESARILERVLAEDKLPAGEQKAAAFALERIADPKSGPAILAAFDKLDFVEAATHAAAAMARIGYGQAGPKILERMKREPNEFYKRDFAASLAALRHKPAIPFIEAMCGRKEFTADWAIQASSNLNSKPECALVRLTGDWGAPSGGGRLLLLAPENFQPDRPGSAALLIENCGRETLDILSVRGGSLIVNGQLPKPALRVDEYDGPSGPPSGYVWVWPVDLTGYLDGPGPWKVRYEVGDLKSNTITLAHPAAKPAPPATQPDAEWGPTIEGLQTRLTLETTEATVGARVYVHLDVRNVGDKPVDVAYVKHLSRFLHVRREGGRADGADVPMIDKSEASVINSPYALEPSKQDEVISDRLDLKFDLSQPGEYAIQWTDVPAKFAPKGQVPPPSNVVRLRIVAAKTPATAPAESPKWLKGSEWSKVAGGLQTRLAVPDGTRFAAGKPIPMRIDLKNAGDKPVRYYDAAGYRSGAITVTDRAGKELRFLGEPLSTTSRGPTLKPGEQVVLSQEFDLASHYYLRKPGTYTVRYTGEHGYMDEAPPIPASPLLEIEVIDDPAAQADGDPVGKLMAALPADWSLWGSTTIGSGLHHPGTGWSRVPGSYIRLVHKSYQLKGPAGPEGIPPVVVWLTLDRAKQESWQPGKDPWNLELVPTEYLGGNRFYHVYIHVPELATKAWPTAGKDIAKALDVSLVPAATQPEGVLKTLSPLAQKLVANLPRGWKLTECGRCDTPIGWSGKTDCEYLTFTHETLKAEVMGLVGPASFTAWLTPGNYAGRLLPQQTAQPREAALVYKRSDRLLFMERPGVVDKDAWAAVEKVLTDVLGFARNPGRASEGREPPAAPPTGLVKPVSEADALSGVAAPPATQPEAFDLDYAAHPVDPRAKPSLPPRELTNRLRRVPDVLRPDSSVFIVGWFNDLAFFDDEVGAECKKVDREVRQLLADDTPAASPAPPATQPVETR